MRLSREHQFGRSMIEMLGVLAIVGILSVGAISGYAKAMRKYKINRLKDEYVWFIHNVLQYDSGWKKEAKRHPDVELFHIERYVYNMGLFPQSWYINNEGWIIDSLGSQFTLFVRQPYGKIDIDYQTKGKKKSSADAKDLCITMAVDVFKSMAANVFRFSAYTEKYDEDGQLTGRDSLQWFGDNYCTKNRKCLQDLNISEIADHCSTCALEDTCRWIIMFD